jgi:hypothetical protein
MFHVKPFAGRARPSVEKDRGSGEGRTDRYAHKHSGYGRSWFSPVTAESSAPGVK